jgi:hypothetical protein
MGRVRLRPSDARNNPRRRHRELRADEYEPGELGGEQQVEVAGAGGEDPVTVPPGRDKHRRRPRDGGSGEWGIENGHPEERLPRVTATVPIRIGGVAEERVGEGEGDEAGRRDATQSLQLRAHGHRRWSPGGGGAERPRAIPSRGFRLGFKWF